MEFEPSTSSSSAAMPDSPPLRAARHRRAQSEILLGGVLPDDLAFYGDLGIVGEEEDEEEEDYDEEGDRLFALLIDAGKLAEPPEPAPHPPPPPPPARPRHQHSYSMDGSTSVASAAGAWRSVPEAKKAVSDAKLAELVLVDPKRAKRILANRQSAARSKERKMRYIAELERKVQTLQTEATTLSAQLAMLQRDTTGLTTENSELKLRVQTMEQQVRLQDALNNRLRDEIQQLKIAAGQASTSSVKMASLGVPSFGANPQSYQRNHMQTLLAAQRLQQLQIHWQHQQQQMYLQQQHQSTDQQQQPPQEALPLPLPGDMKMKGALVSSHTQNGGSSDGHALKSET